jgi:hypothetical protein
VSCICLESGGIDRRLLFAEGAVAVFENPLDLVDHLDDSMIGQWAAETPGV